MYSDSVKYWLLAKKDVFSSFSSFLVFHNVCFSAKKFNFGWLGSKTNEQASEQMGTRGRTAKIPRKSIIHTNISTRQLTREMMFRNFPAFICTVSSVYACYSLSNVCVFILPPSL